MKKILFLTLIAGALLFSASCERKGTIFEIPEDSPLVSFTYKKASFTMVAEDGNKITVSLNRGNTKGDVSVPFTFTDGTEGVFTPAKNTFDFVDGEAVANLDITYPDFNDFLAEVYTMKITIDNEYVSPAGTKELSISAQRKLTKKVIGEGIWYSDWYEEEWEQEICAIEEAPGMYCFPSCWTKGTDFYFSLEDGVPDFGEAFDGGYTYGSYGNVWVYPTNVAIADGVLYIVCHYVLPDLPYDFGGGFYETFTFPEGFTF